MKPINLIMSECTEKLAENIRNMLPKDRPTPELIHAQVLEEIYDLIVFENAHLQSGQKMRAPQKMTPAMIATFMLVLYDICVIKCADTNTEDDYNLLVIYQNENENQNQNQKDSNNVGLYVSTESVFFKIAKRFNYNITNKECEEVLTHLRAEAERKERTTDKNLIAVNNGIFDYKNKILMPFSPEYIFLSKSKVDYNPLAANVVIHNDDDGTDWDVESWMKEIAGNDATLSEFFWEILGAIVRPFVNFNTSAYFYSDTGCNGKGTLCELMRLLCGKGSYASIPLSDFGKDFALEPLIRASAIIVDENDVGTYVDKAANLKAVVTHDVISINRKFKPPIAFRFYGFMVQCLNEYPKIKDKTDSFYRRQLFVPFKKCFTGRERRYIKNDYLHRPEVLEYVLYRVLHMNYDEFTIPACCNTALDEYKEYNDPVRQFLNEMEPRFAWDLLPYSFLYDLYKEWYKLNLPSGQVQGKQKFTVELKSFVRNHLSGKWEVLASRKRPQNLMKSYEPLIIEYNLRRWMNPLYTGNDNQIIARPKLADTYDGLLRVVPSANGNFSDKEDNANDLPEEDETPTPASDSFVP